ncbi:transcriptional regulator, IclR family [Rhizobiales bacterium GAS191]|jgi:DNA-binding IclR family transcriptional regulator|nr:transcriptional regulator, IclR family [Rhizobiales bacterium GAS113]SEE64893.1 transcriptional regulator, IclR family [Rhizobiales bacterium GAS191]
MVDTVILQPNGGDPGMSSLSEPTGSLHRAILIVRAIARGSETGAALTEVVAWTGLPRSTIHRVLDMLIESGWVERDAQTRRFHLGAEFLTLGIVAAARHPIERAAATEIAVLAQEIGQTIYLIVKAGLDGVCAARQESASRIQTLVLKVGSHVPLGWGAGSMALLAALPRAEADEVIERNRKRYVEIPSFDPAAFAKAVEDARGRGFASHDGLFTRGISGIGVPVRDRSFYPVAAISTAFVTDWLDDAQRLRCAARLNETALRIAKRLVDIRSRP